MEWSLLFFFNSALLGVGLAMDAFSVSMANGLHDPKICLLYTSMRPEQIISLVLMLPPMTDWGPILSSSLALTSPCTLLVTSSTLPP